VPGNRPIDDVMSEFEKEIILQFTRAKPIQPDPNCRAVRISRHALRYRMQRLNINTGPESRATPSACPGRGRAMH